MRSKVLIVVVALVLGGLAAVFAARYLQGARSDIAAESEPVAVLVAQQDIPKGISASELVEQGYVAEEQVPRRFVAGDAVSSIRSVEDQVLAVSVSAGEQLTKGRFQYPAQAGLSYTVPEDFVALSIDVDDVTGVSGLLKPGDNVVVFVTFEPDDPEAKDFTSMAIAKARVLAVGAETSAEAASSTEDQEESGLLGGAAAGSRSGTYQTVTLALSTGDAQALVFAREKGAIHLALLPKNAEAPAKIAPVTLAGE